MIDQPAHFQAIYTPRLPQSLQIAQSCGIAPCRQTTIGPDLVPYFSKKTIQQNQVLELVRGARAVLSPRPLRVGVIFSGGPAPGGHAVLAGIVDLIHYAHPESCVLGFLGGPQGLLLDEFRLVSKEEALAIRNTGGFDFLGTGRTKIEGESALQSALKVVQKEVLDGLIVIGGDDSNTNAAIMADYFEAHGVPVSVIGVPKTIDGDLSAQELPLSFGFDTATRTYAETIGNLSKDLLSTKKQYFFVRLMGRDASHITLECALKTQPNMAILGEEVLSKKMTLHDVVTMASDLIEERLEHQKAYGLILVPEGLIEHIVDIRELIKELNSSLFHPAQKMEKTTNTYDDVVALLSDASRHCFLELPESIRSQLLLDRDPHGNVSVSKIETEKALALLVEKELERRSIIDGKKRPFTFQTYFCGYEGRCQFPSFFDLEYSYALGRLAALGVSLKLNGYMVAIDQLQKDVADWKPYFLPLLSMMSMEMRRGALKPVIAKTKVDLQGKAFKSFQQARTSWRVEDCYRQPGPIQYTAESASTERPCILRLHS